ncbi:1,2-dihydroxy-3-keto-5-methylthiopentene dioxygenase [Ectopseudomonas composti]|uniref:1,2-dihydroxy-3-keto-5-methylthiopentene dioxygenase n=1 Tax=Ectopseudomonas composti TaxID=658457 RepID=A0A1I5SJL8_9GAMM|nr:acireductone dioxygenase [Pseudomonas composti]SFP70903.1 1,2-dihydroxy-3-keto-5-methylthiopentene dioxygenase [Pseudomonas composti]
MSSLAVYLHTAPELPNKVLNHAEDIASTLATVGIDYRQVALPAALRPGCEQAEFDAAYGLWLQAFMSEEGHVQQELFNLQRNHPQKLELRARHLDEQSQSMASAWLFLGGFAQLSLHLDDHVYMLQGEKGDLLLLPAGTRYWFDLGEEPHALVVRLSASEDAPVCSDDDIASRFARLGD